MDAHDQRWVINSNALLLDKADCRDRSTVKGILTEALGWISQGQRPCSRQAREGVMVDGRLEEQAYLAPVGTGERYGDRIASTATDGGDRRRSTKRTFKFSQSTSIDYSSHTWKFAQYSRARGE